MKKSMAGVYLIKSERLYNEFMKNLNKENVEFSVHNLWDYIQSGYGDFCFCIKIEQYDERVFIDWDFIDHFRNTELNIGNGLKGRYCIHEYKGGYITTERGFAIGDLPIALSQEEVSKIKGVYL